MKPKTPASHARSACIRDRNAATKATMDFALEVVASSVLHAAGVDVNSDTAPEMAPPARSWSHWLATRVARFASAIARVVMYTSIGPEPRHGFNPAGISADCRMAVSYTHLRAHETRHDLVCRLLLEKKK